MKKKKAYLAAALGLILLVGIAVYGGGAEMKTAQDAYAAGDGSGKTAFADVAQSAWYSDAVSYVYERGLMVGVSDDSFSPGEDFTRAQLATVLYRMAGKPEVTGEDSFTDTTAGSWYSDAVLWAEQNAVINGIGGGLFGTANAVTQEQLATMLWRIEGEPAAERAEDASEYAATAVGWAREKKIAPVSGSYIFAPKEAATRAEIAFMLTNYLGSEESAVTVANAAFITTNGGAVISKAELPYLSDSAEAPEVYYISDISAESLEKIYAALGWEPGENLAVKLSTGESERSNYLRPELIGKLVNGLNGTIVESNTAYGGSRASVAAHKQLAADHGLTTLGKGFDLLDEDGNMTLPVSGARPGSKLRISENYVGSHLENYDSALILSHFKGHAMAGFGGAIKNISIGFASGQSNAVSGKVWIHSGGARKSGSIMGDSDAFLEAMGDAGLSVSQYFGEGKNIVYINVMNRLSVDCDCDGNPSEPDMHDIGILASRDPVALDSACIDLVYAASDSASLIRRIESRNGIHTLEHAEEIGLGSRSYRLVDIDG